MIYDRKQCREELESLLRRKFEFMGVPIWERFIQKVLEIYDRSHEKKCPKKESL